MMIRYGPDNFINQWLGTFNIVKETVGVVVVMRQFDHPNCVTIILSYYLYVCTLVDSQVVVSRTCMYVHVLPRAYKRREGMQLHVGKHQNSNVGGECA